MICILSLAFRFLQWNSKCKKSVWKGSRLRNMNYNFQKTDDARLFALITQAKSNDQAAFEELLNLYAPLIESMTAGFCNTDSPLQDREDLRQEATLGFYRAVISFDPTQDKVNFGAYAKTCIRNRLISFLRTLERHQKTLLTNDEASLVQDGNDSTGDPGSELVEWENFQELSRLIRETLSPSENRIWRLYLSGRTAKETGMLLGKDDKSVQNAVYRIRRKLREVIPYS
jgi:RNA polymerase sporulation-specific sigma factor